MAGPRATVKSYFNKAWPGNGHPRGVAFNNRGKSNRQLTQEGIFVALGYKRFLAPWHEFTVVFNFRYDIKHLLLRVSVTWKYKFTEIKYLKFKLI